VFIMGTTVTTSLLGYIFWVVAARAYSAYDVGLASALISGASFASALSILGVSSTMIQTLPKRANGRPWSIALNTGMLVGTISGLAGGVCLVVLMPAISGHFSLLRVSPLADVLLLVNVPLWSIATILDFTFIAERRAGRMLLRNSVFSAVKISLLLVPVIVGTATTVAVLGSWTAATLASVVVGVALMLALNRGWQPAVKGAWAEARRMLSSMAGNHLINLGGSLPLYLLPVLVTVRLSATANAYFYTTWMIGGLFFMVSNSVAASLFAEGSHAAEHLRSNVVKSARITAILLVPAMLVCVLFGRYIMNIFGPAYPNHGFGLLLVLTVAGIPDAITAIFVSAMRVQGRLRLCGALTISMATITLGLAWILVPRMGVMGAGVAWLIGQTAGTVVVVGYVALQTRRRTFVQPIPVVFEVEPSAEIADLAVGSER
jgi:O-antigen/teichoic acid export membrane protein